MRDGGEEGDRPITLPIGVESVLVRLEGPSAVDVGGGAIGETLCPLSDEADEIPFGREADRPPDVDEGGGGGAAEL